MVMVTSGGSMAKPMRTGCNSGFYSGLPRPRGLCSGTSRNKNAAASLGLTGHTKGNQGGICSAVQGDLAEAVQAPEEAPIVRPAKFETMEFRGRIPPRTRLVFPSHVKNQRVSAMCPGGDYSYMRNALRITDARPNVPSAMFPATADWDKAEEEYRNAISTVTAKKGKWRGQFIPPPAKTTGTDRGLRVFGLGLRLFSTDHDEFFGDSSIEQYDFVGASTSDNQPLPVPGGRGGCETDGALFASRITGELGGFVHASYVQKITIITYEPDAISHPQETSSAADRLAALRWMVAEVKRDERTDLVSIVYDPENPFTDAESACIEELLEPEASAVVFLIPKDEPVDMATDPRYAVMRSLQAAGALVVSSVDGDYLRTPLTRAGWGLFDYNVVVGDMEAPLDNNNTEWRFVEGTSVTAAAAATAACIVAMNVIDNLAAPPSVIKQVLSSAAVDLNQTLSPETIASLEAYRDQCIEDCELMGHTSAPEYLSMSKGLALDAPILRFNVLTLWRVREKLFSEA